MSAVLPAAVGDLLVRACADEAARIGCPMAIALVDAEGGLICFLRMDGTLPASTELARGKAYSAAALRMGTDALGRLAQPGAALFGIGESLPGRLVLFGGGLPLRLGGVVVGAVGVSGGTVEQDVAVAARAAALMEAMEEWAQRLRPRLAGSDRPGVAAPGTLAVTLEREFAAGLPASGAGQAAALAGGAILAMDIGA